MPSRRGLVQRTLLAIMIVSGALAPSGASASGPSTPTSPLPLGLASAQQEEVAPTAVGDRIQRSTSRSRDLTGDGWPDVLAREPGQRSGALWVFTHSGNPQGNVFSAKTLVGTNWNTITWIGVAELTGDTPEYEDAAEEPADILARRNDGTLLIYPHSGGLNGINTWLTPVVVGTNWNIYEKMFLADINSDGYEDIIGLDYDDLSVYLYLHSGTFNGKSTYRPRTHLFSGTGFDVNNWSFFTEWSRENPDVLDILVGGTGTAYRHTGTVNGASTWDLDHPWDWPVADQFSRETTLYISLLDVNGDGKNDVVKTTPGGALLYFPVRGWGASPPLGPPVQIGNGWQVMDLIT